jgi:putative endonuclease
MDLQPAVYILTNCRNGTLYTGVTSNLLKRTWEHRQHLVPGFAAEHGCDLLVYFEMHETMYAAITREKQIKNWRIVTSAPPVSTYGPTRSTSR